MATIPYEGNLADLERQLHQLAGTAGLAVNTASVRKADIRIDDTSADHFVALATRWGATSLLIERTDVSDGEITELLDDATSNQALEHQQLASDAPRAALLTIAFAADGVIVDLTFESTWWSRWWTEAEALCHAEAEQQHAEQAEMIPVWAEQMAESPRFRRSPPAQRHSVCRREIDVLLGRDQIDLVTKVAEQLMDERLAPDARRRYASGETKKHIVAALHISSTTLDRYLLEPS